MIQRKIEVGQIWESTDPRDRKWDPEKHEFVGGRRVKVVYIDPYGHQKVGVINTVTGRKTWIRRDRFRPGSTGYRLVEEAPGTSPIDTDAPMIVTPLTPEGEPA